MIPNDQQDNDQFWKPPTGKIVKKLSTLTTEGKVMHSSGSRDLPSLGLSGKSVQDEDIN